MTDTASDGPALVDTNIVVYAHDEDEPVKQSKARELLVRLSDEGRLVFSAQTLNEFCSVMMRPKRRNPLTPASMIEVASDLASLATVVPVTPSMTLLALDAMTRHSLSFWDALIWAAAKENGAKTLYSEDFQDGRDLDGVRVVNPLARP